ncbi:MAG: ABC transporter substrate-binding protein [Dehalococcoidia bacterium]|nr:ABC transporter substrate-binding protein [Dehalococcoidia bacterium]
MAESDNYWLRRKVSRRSALRGSALAGMGAATYALVGCGDDDDDDDGGNGGGVLPTAQASPTAAKTPVAGGSFSFQISSNPPSLDPYTQTSFVTAYNHGLSYSKLFRFKAGTPDVAPADNTMETDLASAMPEQPDPLTFIIKIKPGAKFQNVAPVNGRAVTSDDIVYALDRYKNFEKSVHKTSLSFVDKLEKVDAGTVKITTKLPYADFVNYLGGNIGAWISPREMAESPDAATKMVGSGPFILDEFKTGVSLKYKKNPDYFDKPYPYFDDVTAFVVTDQAKRVADFSSKQVNLTWLFLPTERDQLKKERADAKLEETQGIGGYIYLRTDRPPFNDKRVRQAISMGLNRPAIRAAISKGEGVDEQLYHVGFPFARQVKDLPAAQAKLWQHNIAEAKKLMAAAIGEGKTIDTTWDHADAAIYTQAYVDSATLAQAQLKEIGINIKDQTAPYAQYISTTYQGQYEGMGHSPRAVPYWLDFVTERFTMKPARGRINLSYVNDPKLEDLLDKQRGQFKQEERLQTVKQIEELVAEEQYEIYFSTDTRTYFWDKDIENYRPTAWFPYTHLMKTWRGKA